MSLRGWMLLAAGLLMAGGCSDGGTAPPGPPYLAIVTRVDVAPGVQPDSFYAYHIRDYAGTNGVDTVVTAAPRDTVILSVKPARYIVTIGNVPAECAIRQGAEQEVLIPEETNTAVVRYTITCLPRITLQVSTEGTQKDPEYIYRVVGNEVDRSGPIDSLPIYLDDLPTGDYQVELANVRNNCTVISLGGNLQRATIADTLSPLVYFRVACSDPTTRPRLVTLASAVFDGSVALLGRVIDPDRDLDLYAADFTDCRGHSLLPNGGIEPRNLYGTRLRLEDTATVMLTLNTRDVPDSLVRAGCVWFRMGDANGNSTEVREQPVGGAGPGTPSTFVRLNGFISGSLTNYFVDLQADDTDGDFLGVVARLRLRDGTLGPPDGIEDGATYNVIGYRGTDLPVVPVGEGQVLVNYFDILGLEVFLFDAAGHITRGTDDRL